MVVRCTTSLAAKRSCEAQWRGVAERAFKKWANGRRVVLVATLMPYEIVIHCRGVKEEITSPETYSTAEEAAADLEPLHVAIAGAADEVMKLPWFGGAGANIICVHVRHTEASRGSSAPTIEEAQELVKRMSAILAHPSVGPQTLPAPRGQSATDPDTGQSGPTPPA